MEIKNLYYHIVVLRIMGLFYFAAHFFFLPLLQTIAEDRKQKTERQDLNQTPKPGHN